MNMKISDNLIDLTVAAGVVSALLLSIFWGSSAELQTTLAGGLIGYLGGKTSVERRKE